MSILTKTKVQTLDTTLRDGLIGRELNYTQRFDILQKIKAVPFDYLEVLTFAPNLITNEDLLPDLVEADGKISHLVFPHEKAISSAGSAATTLSGTGDDSFRLHTFYSVSGAELPGAGYDDTETSGSAQKLKAIRKSILACRDYTADVQWTAFDGPNADEDFLLDAFATALDAGARTVGLPDSMGDCPAEKFAGLCRKIIDSSAHLKSGRAKLSVHTHNGMGQARDSVKGALEAGAGQIEGTLLGCGRAGGNLDWRLLDNFHLSDSYQTAEDELGTALAE